MDRTRPPPPPQRDSHRHAYAWADVVLAEVGPQRDVEHRRGLGVELVPADGTQRRVVAARVVRVSAVGRVAREPLASAGVVDRVDERRVLGVGHEAASAGPVHEALELLDQGAGQRVDVAVWHEEREEQAAGPVARLVGAPVDVERDVLEPVPVGDLELALALQLGGAARALGSRLRGGLLRSLSPEHLERASVERRQSGLDRAAIAALVGADAGVDLAAVEAAVARIARTSLRRRSAKKALGRNDRRLTLITSIFSCSDSMRTPRDVSSSTIRREQTLHSGSARHSQ